MGPVPLKGEIHFLRHKRLVERVPFVKPVEQPVQARYQGNWGTEQIYLWYSHGSHRVPDSNTFHVNICNVLPLVFTVVPQIRLMRLGVVGVYHLVETRHRMPLEKPEFTNEGADHASRICSSRESDQIDFVACPFLPSLDDEVVRLVYFVNQTGTGGSAENAIEKTEMSADAGYIMHHLFDSRRAEALYRLWKYRFANKGDIGRLVVGRLVRGLPGSYCQTVSPRRCVPSQQMTMRFI